MEATELLWESREKDGVKEAFNEVVEALLFHERLFFSPKEGVDLGSMNSWELLVWILLSVEKRLEGGNEKKILGFLISFFDSMAKNLEKKLKKLEFAGKNDRKNGFKVLLNLMSYTYYDIPEFRAIMLICVNKIVKVFLNEGENESLGFENVQIFNQTILKCVGDKLTMEEVFFVIDEIIEILKNSKNLMFWLFLVNVLIRKLERVSGIIWIFNCFIGKF